MAGYNTESLVTSDETMEHLLLPYRRAIEEGLAQVKEKDKKLSEVAFEYVRSSGKLLRPTIVLLSCDAVGGSRDKALPIAIAYELAHSASLTQDDIIDNSSTRHNKSTAHTKHGVTTAILISDMLIFEIFEQLARYASKELSARKVGILISYVSRAAKEMAEGEFLEMQLSKRMDPSVDDYLELASLKTGALFGAAAASGAVVGGAKQQTLKDLYEFGINLGISFQMRDDILDMTGSAEVMGKPLLKDMQNNAANIVLVHALSHANAQQKIAIRGMMARNEYGLADAVAVKKILDDLGSLDYASGYCVKHAAIARARLKSLPRSSARHTLEELTLWLEGRRS